MFLHVLEACHVREYVIRLKFSDGTSGDVDLRTELEGPVFGALKEIDQFKRFSVARHTLTWSNGADFAPEFLRERIAVTA